MRTHPMLIAGAPAMVFPFRSAAAAKVLRVTPTISRKLRPSLAGAVRAVVSILVSILVSGAIASVVDFAIWIV